ncbi:MAG: ABC transporter ATP-binding protein [Candidatus Kariarchaeaceae archaeon]
MESKNQNETNVIIHAEELIKIYTDPDSGLQVPALRGVELIVEYGELVSIIGPSGSGKSTLLHILAGMDNVSSGHLEIAGARIDTMSKKELADYRKRYIGIIWQFPEKNLFYDLSVFDNIELPMRLLGISKAKRRERVLALLEEVGMSHRKHHTPRQISGGEAQRVSLAVALANDPPLLLADEPTGELDNETASEIISYLIKLNRERGKTLVIVTHDTRLAKTTDKSFQIEDGRISRLNVKLKALTTEDLKEGSKDFAGFLEGQEQEERIFVDAYGNMRLPRNIRQLAGIRNQVKVKYENGKIIIESAE